MAKTVNVVLKDRNGEAMTYTGIDTVKLPTDTGETASFSLGGGGSAQAAKPEISIYTGEPDTETGIYKDACVATKNLLRGVNLSVTGAQTGTVYDPEKWAQEKEHYMPDGIYVPDAKVIVQLSEKTKKDLAVLFYNLNFKNKALREWAANALTQVQVLDFADVAKADDPEHIDIAKAILLGFAAPNGLLGMGPVLGSAVAIQKQLSAMLGQIAEYLYIFGAELEVYVQTGGANESPAVSEKATWYFNCAAVKGTDSAVKTEFSQTLKIGDKALYLATKGDDDPITPVYSLATDKTVITRVGGTPDEFAKESADVHAYKEGTPLLRSNFTWVEEECEVSAYSMTAEEGGAEQELKFLAVDGHGLLYVCANGTDGQPPVSSNPYEKPAVQDGKLTCADGAGLAIEEADEDVLVAANEGSAALTDIAANLKNIFDSKESFKLRVRMVGMKQLPSEALELTIDTEGNVL